MIWTTPLDTLQPRNLAVIESYLRHHPQWPLHLYFTDLAELDPTIASFSTRGYNVTVHRLTDEFLDGLECPPAGKEWLSKREEHGRGPFYYSHLTDILRFCLLWAQPSIYSDMDALLLAPLNPPAYAQQYARRAGACELWVGKDRVEAGAMCDWCLAAGEHNFYLAPGLMGSLKAKSSVLAKALSWINANYNATVFNLAGPMAFTVAAKGRAEVAMLPGHLFYPVSWQDCRALFAAIDATQEKPPWQQEGRVRWARIQRQATSLHLYGGTTGRLPIERGSPAWYALQDLDASRPRLHHPAFLAAASPIIPLRALRVVNHASGRLLLELEVSEGWLRLGEQADRMLSLAADSEAALNSQLDRLEYHGQRDGTGIGELRAKLSRVTPSGMLLLAQTAMPLYQLSVCLTVIVKTMGRMHKVLPLVESIQRYYPGLKIMVGDDGDWDRQAELLEEQRGFWLLRLPWDVGLAEGRNRLLQRVQSAMVLLLDDDFLLNEHSDLGRLVQAVWKGGYDIAAGKSPRDWQQWKFDFAGRMHSTNKRLVITPSQQSRVDIVPNLMVGKTEQLRQLAWDPALKVGEHEDFFWRAKQAGWRITSLPTVEFIHVPEEHPDPAYKALRDRAPHFQAQFLRKHGFQSLIGWGHLIMHLDDLNQTELVEAWYEQLMPFSVVVGWTSPTFHHLWQVEIRSGHGSLPDQVLALGPSQCRDPLQMTLRGLDPSTAYEISIRAGNHTHLAETASSTLKIKTPSLRWGNLLQNPCLDYTAKPWYPTLGTRIKPVEVSDTLLPGRWHQYPAEFPRDLGLRGTQNMAIALWSGLSHLQADLVIAPPRGFCQTVNITCLHAHCRLLASGWARVDHFVNTHGLVPRLELILKLNDAITWTSPWPWYRNGEWQLATLQVLIRQSPTPLQLTLCAWMEMTMGAVFFDNFYLAIQPFSDE